MRMGIASDSAPDYELMSRTRDVADRRCHVSPSAPAHQTPNYYEICVIYIKSTMKSYLLGLLTNKTDKTKKLLLN